MYWSYPKNRLFKAIGADSMLMEVDSTGTFLGGSSVYATARDYARFGQLYLQVGCSPLHPSSAANAPKHVHDQSHFVSTSKHVVSGIRRYVS